MTSKNNRALLLYYVKLCAPFRIHWWIQTGFTVQKRSIRVEIGDMLSRVTLKFDEWPWKTTGHLFYATSSFVQHFVAIGEFKLELQSGNAQLGSNSTIFRAVQPWNLTDDLEKTRQIRTPVLRIPPAVTSQAKMKNWLHECQKWVSHMIGQYAHI